VLFHNGTMNPSFADLFSTEQIKVLSAISIDGSLKIWISRTELPVTQEWNLRFFVPVAPNKYLGRKFEVDVTLKIPVTVYRRYTLNAAATDPSLAKTLDKVLLLYKMIL
jgi:hypothetical protein